MYSSNVTILREGRKCVYTKTRSLGCMECSCYHLVVALFTAPFLTVANWEWLESGIAKNRAS